MTTKKTSRPNKPAKSKALTAKYADQLMPNHRRWRLKRINFIDQELLAGKTLSAVELAKQFDVTPQVIHEDVKIMREVYSRRVDLDYSTKRYFYDEDYLEIGPIQLMPARESDVLGLVAAKKVLHNARGTCLDKSITTAVRRIASASSDKVTLLLGDWEHAVSFHISGYQIIDPKIFDTVLKATVHQKRLKIGYISAKQETTYREIDPYHMSNINGDWYIFVFDHLRKRMRTLVPCRIISVERTGESFQRPKKFSLEKYLKKSFAVWYGDDDIEHKVVIRFLPEVAYRVLEKRWKCQTGISRLEGGGVELRLTVSSLMDVRNWLGTWSGAFTVVQPLELRELIHHDFLAGLKNNPLILPTS